MTISLTLPDVVASGVIVLRNFVWVITSPYKAMRSISRERDVLQVGIVFVIVSLYFVLANIIRNRTLHPFVISSSSLVSLSIFLATFFLAVSFFYIVSPQRDQDTTYKSLMSTFAYSLFPTLIWFFVTSVLYLFLPPPRTQSLLGQSFSFVFIVFSVTMLLWRLILLYLSLRFSLKTRFFTTVYLMLLFGAWFIPYSMILYHFRIFRVPFI